MISAIQARKHKLNHKLTETASVKSVLSVYQWFPNETFRVLK